MTHLLYVCQILTNDTKQFLIDILYLLPDIWYFLFETLHIPYSQNVTCYLLIIVTRQYAKYDVCDKLLDITCKENDFSRSYIVTRSCFLWAKQDSPHFYFLCVNVLN